MTPGYVGSLLLVFAKLALDIYTTGRAQIKDLIIQPNESFRNSLHTIVSLGNQKLFAFDWIVMGSIRNTENDVLNYTQPFQMIAAATAGFEICKWVNKSGGKTFNALIKCLKDVLGKPQALVYPKEGRFTFDVEGHEGGLYHSRTLHVPNADSGLTLGRGFDMKKRSKSEIYSYLVKSGISVKNAQKISKASGLSGQNAKMFIINNDLLDFQISPRQQKNLFILCYEFAINDIKRILKGSLLQKKYGSCNFDTLNSAIKTILVDLRFRGDYHPSSRTFIQKPISDNDLEAFKTEMGNRSNWSKVPKDRFDSRIAFLAKN